MRVAQNDSDDRAGLRGYVQFHKYTYIRTYIHTHIHIYIHTYIQQYVRELRNGLCGRKSVVFAILEAMTTDRDLSQWKCNNRLQPTVKGNKIK